MILFSAVLPESTYLLEVSSKFLALFTYMLAVTSQFLAVSSYFFGSLFSVIGNSEETLNN